MSSQRKRVCLISSGINPHNLPLQPWRYLHETARQLSGLGHEVTILTDGGNPTPVSEEIESVQIKRLPSINRMRWGTNQPLQKVVEELEPDCILWHLGLPSFFHQRLDGWPAVPLVGIFPGLIYRPGELIRNGVKKLVKGYRLSAIHVLGASVPRPLLRRSLRQNKIKHMVVQTNAAAERLALSGFPSDQIKVIPPGVDQLWHEGNLQKAVANRVQLGFCDTDTVIVYFGSPAPLRGLHTVIQALEIARRTHPSLKLLILSRRRMDELQKEDRELKKLLQKSEVEPHVKVVSGFLPPETLRDYVLAADAAALPFELIPSDAPLSVLEAQALGKPVITSHLACLPELVSAGKHYLALPGHPYSLALAFQTAAEEKHNREIGFRTTTEFARPMFDRGWHKVGEEWSQFIQNL